MCPVLLQGTVFQMYSLMPFVFIGFVVSLSLAVKNRPDGFLLKRPEMLVMSTLMLMLGTCLAKLLYVFLSRNAIHNIVCLPIHQIHSAPGYVFSGTLATEIFVLAAFTKLKGSKNSFLEVADYIMPFLFLFQSIASVGLFLSGFSYGKPTNLSWGVAFKTVDPVLRHPTQIYSVIFLLFIYFAARYIYRMGLPRGVTFFSALSMYGIARFFNEFLRVDSPKVFGPITLAQIALLSLAAVSVFSTLFILSKDKCATWPISPTDRLK